VGLGHRPALVGRVLPTLGPCPRRLARFRPDRTTPIYGTGATTGTVDGARYRVRPWRLLLIGTIVVALVLLVVVSVV